MAAEQELLVKVDHERRAAQLTINREKKRGALSRTVFTELTAQLKVLGRDPKVSCIILASSGPAFSAGNDVLGDTPPDPVARAAIEAIEECPVPVVAAVQGFAFTGALEVLVAADIILAGETAYFQDTHAKLGLVPTWGGNVRLPRRIGLHRAKELMFTCRRFSAQDACDWGLVNRVVPDAELLAEAWKLADEIAANSRSSIEKQKRMMTDAAAHSQYDALRWTTRFHPGHGDDMKERMLSLRKPAGKKPAAKL